MRIATTTVTASNTICVASSPRSSGPSSQIEATAIAGMVSPMLAIADPRVAPYGVAAIETLRKLNVYDARQPKLVQGTSITQAYQFVQTGAAELGFVALSQVVNEPGGSRWQVPASFHAPIAQQAILPRSGEKNPAARAFFAFLKSPAAKAIVRRYGYEAP